MLSLKSLVKLSRSTSLASHASSPNAINSRKKQFKTGHDENIVRMILNVNVNRKKYSEKNYETKWNHLTAVLIL